MKGIARWSFRRETVIVWDFSRLKDIFQVFDQLVILSRSAELEEAPVYIYEGWKMLRQRVE